MKKLLFIIFLSCNIFAQDTSQVYLNGLSKEQQALIIAQVEKAKNEAKQPSVSTPQQVDQWVNTGERVAKLLPIFAKELGVAADQVLNSFSGKVLLAIVLFHIFWTKIFGILMLTFGPMFWWAFFKRMFLIEKQEVIVHPNPIFAFFGRQKKLTSYHSLRALVSKEASYTNNMTTTDLDTAWLFISAVLLVAILGSGITGIFI
jgi:hypothetical protein